MLRSSRIKIISSCQQQEPAKRIFLNFGVNPVILGLFLVSGLLMGTISMLQLGLPHATVLNKCDLIEDLSVVDDL